MESYGYSHKFTYFVSHKDKFVMKKFSAKDKHVTNDYCSSKVPLGTSVSSKKLSQVKNDTFNLKN